MRNITMPGNAILLLEGGSLRGLYTAGVLDTFMENDIYFPAVAGVSAGTLNAMNYVAHQPGRAASINLRYRHDGRYFGPKAALRGGSLFGLNFMLHDVKKEVPFDEEAFANGGMRLIAVATNVKTGKPAYFEKGKTDFDFNEAARASASLPLASVPVMLDGQPYLDGGCSCPIALNWALQQGFEKIVVVATRQKGFRKSQPGQRMVDRMTPSTSAGLRATPASYWTSTTAATARAARRWTRCRRIWKKPEAAGLHPAADCGTIPVIWFVKG